VGGTDADSVNDCELPELGDTVIVTEYDVTIVLELKACTYATKNTAFVVAPKKPEALLPCS